LAGSIRVPGEMGERRYHDNVARQAQTPFHQIPYPLTRPCGASTAHHQRRLTEVDPPRKGRGERGGEGLERVNVTAEPEKGRAANTLTAPVATFTAHLAGIVHGQLVATHSWVPGPADPRAGATRPHPQEEKARQR